jgi:purine-nucleoside phosphorylase
VNEAARQSATIIGARCPYSQIDIAIILDDKFSGLVEVMTIHDRIAYGELPDFPVGAGIEHGEVFIGVIDEAPALVLQGVATFHETGDPCLMSGPLETLSLLGVNAVLMIGTGHSLRADVRSGHFVAISDHINFTGFDPLIGQGCGFLDLTDAYDRRLVRRLKLAATQAVGPMKEGVLIWFSGPACQTPAEARMARMLGADVIGWSMAPEAILARRLGLPFAAIALVTNQSSMFDAGKHSPEQAMTVIAANVAPLKRLLKSFIRAV